MTTSTVTLADFLLVRIEADSLLTGADRASKRRIVELHSGLFQCEVCTEGEEYDEDSEGNRSYFALMERSPCRTLRLLALPYDQHPDFRPEWRS